MGIVKEFKEFALRGNVLDLAVGVIIGAAFSAIVTSLVQDIFMPLIGIITGGHDFNGLSYKVGNAMIAYGKFIQATITFLLVAFVLFLIIKGANSVKKKEVETPAAPIVPTKEEALLAEIRDILKTRP